MSNITTRSKIAVRYTTAPADLGYSGTPTNWRTGPADIITSPAKALDYLTDLKRKMGGTYYAVEMRHGGKVVTQDDLMYVVSAAESRRYRWTGD